MPQELRRTEQTKAGMDMNDLYREILVKRITPTADKIKSAALVALTVLCLAGSLVFWPLLLGGIALGVASFLLIPRFNLEYEYLYVNGDIDVDKIMSRQKRKRCASYSLENLEVMAPTGSHALDSFRSGGNTRTRDFTSLDPQASSYTLVFHSGESRELVRLELEEDVVRDMRRLAPRKVFLD